MRVCLLFDLTNPLFLFNVMINISLIGVGHLGKIHCKLLKQLSIDNSNINFCGVFDVDKALAENMANEYNVNSFESIDVTIDNSDAVFVVVPTSYHFEIVKQCLQKDKHCFVEKPVVSTIKDALELKKMADEHPKCKIQVGHIERFNPAIVEISKYQPRPMFIEAHRLSQFHTRATDTSVIHDLMIHDIDLVLWLVGSDVKSIDANGLAIITNTIDIANARLKFANGAVANITASRISAKPMRKIRLFQKYSYISIDLQNPSIEAFRLASEGDSNNVVPALMLGEIDKVQSFPIVFVKPDIPQTNAMANEQRTFVDAIINNTNTAVTLQDGIRALEVACEIEKLINAGSQVAQ
jgi:predicted dehydrogenase